MMRRSRARERCTELTDEQARRAAKEARRPGEEWLEAYPPPRWSVRLSLPAALSTALVMVDYALHGSATPTDWPRAVAERIPTHVAEEWRLLRPIVAHGTVWRDYVLLQLPPEHPAHADWHALRAWVAERSDDDVRALVVEGVLSGLRFYRDHMQPLPVVEEYLAAAGGRAPRREQLAADDALRAGVAALAASWSAPVEAIVSLAADAARLRRALLAMLDAVWEYGFGREWEENWPRLRRAVGAAARRIEETAGRRGDGAGSGVPMSPGLAELMLAVTGRQLSSQVLDRLGRAGHIVFFPCLALDQYVSVEETAYGWPEEERPREWRIFFEPLPEAAGRSPRPAPAGVVGEPDVGVQLDSGAGYGAWRLDEATAARSLEALGDRMRLALVRCLHESGEMFTGELAERLGVHPSTASRQLAQLEAAGLVRVRREGKLKFYTLDVEKLRALAAFLQQQFE